MTNSFTVRDMPLEERPRERLVKYGAEAVSAQELIAVVLGRGTAGQSVMTIARNLLTTFGSLEGVVNASLQQLQQVPGLGPAKALQLKACLEIARRVIADEAKEEKRRGKEKLVLTPEDIASLIREHIRDFHKEHFYIISFDNRNRPLAVDLAGVGTLNANLVHPRETFAIAIKRGAASLAVSHNHPSGDPNPSEADLTITKRLHEAGDLMGIKLLDHVIVTRTTLFSFKEKSLI